MITKIIIQYSNEEYYDWAEVYTSDSGGGSVALKMSPDGVVHLTFNQFLEKIYNRYCIIKNQRKFISLMFNEFSLQFKH